MIWYIPVSLCGKNQLYPPTWGTLDFPYFLRNCLHDLKILTSIKPPGLLLSSHARLAGSQLYTFILFHKPQGLIVLPVFLSSFLLLHTFLWFPYPSVMAAEWCVASAAVPDNKSSSLDRFKSFIADPTGNQNEGNHSVPSSITRA